MTNTITKAIEEQLKGITGVVEGKRKKKHKKVDISEILKEHGYY